MSITFIGPAGSCEFPWIRYALLRDSVLHHYDHGQMSPSFSELYRVGDALGGRRLSLPARNLRAQLTRAQALCMLSISNLAVSARTKAVIGLTPDVQDGPVTQLIGPNLHRPWLSGELQTLGDVFGQLIRDLLQITSGSSLSDVVEVVDS